MAEAIDRLLPDSLASLARQAANGVRSPLEGTRDVLLINSREMARAGLREGQVVSLASDAGDGVRREVGGLAVTPFDPPDGCLGGYYPEMNPLMPLSHHDGPSKTPAAKSVPVWIDATDRSGLFSAQGKASGEARRPRPGDATPHPVPS